MLFLTNEGGDVLITRNLKLVLYQKVNIIKKIEKQTKKGINLRHTFTCISEFEIKIMQLNKSSGIYHRIHLAKQSTETHS